jgi:quercetin dioxygenase-like cupin family protein
MPYAIYDFRTDVKNLFVTPRIRSRFLRMEPGEVAGRHSHDLGHEIFLILEGTCEMEIDGEVAVLGPGHLCVAFAHQMHQARNTGDVPMTMYLSVTPHVLPTHTRYDPETGERLPPSYFPPSTYHQVDAVADVSTAELADRHLAELRSLASVAQAASEAGEFGVAAVKEAAAQDDPRALAAAIDELGSHVRTLYDRLDAMTEAWNHLASRAAGSR